MFRIAPGNQLYEQMLAHAEKFSVTHANYIAESKTFQTNMTQSLSQFKNDSGGSTMSTILGAASTSKPVAEKKTRKKNGS